MSGEGLKMFAEASGGSRTHNLRFTKPELCQLSYTSADRLRWRAAEYSNQESPGKADPRKLPTSSESGQISRNLSPSTLVKPLPKSIPIQSADQRRDFSIFFRTQEFQTPCARQSYAISPGSSLQSDGLAPWSPQGVYQPVQVFPVPLLRPNRSEKQ